MMTYFSTSVGTTSAAGTPTAILFDVLIAIPQQTTESHTPHDVQYTHKGIPSKNMISPQNDVQFPKYKRKSFQNSLEIIQAILHFTFEFDITNKGIVPN